MMLSVSGQCTDFLFLTSVSTGPLASADIDLREFSGISLVNLINVLIDARFDDFHCGRAIKISEPESVRINDSLPRRIHVPCCIEMSLTLKWGNFVGH